MRTPVDTDIQRYVSTMPQYKEPLHFLQDILDFQAALAEKVEPGPRIEPDLAREKWRAGQYLLAGEALSMPSHLFWQALEDLRAWLPPGGAARENLEQLLRSVSVTPSNAQVWLDDLVADPTKYARGDADIQRLADATSTDPEMLALLLRTVLSPFFQKQAAPYQELLEMAAWRRGRCPVCGSPPWMARLTADNGHRMLACSLCRTEWTFDRLRCPFCEGDNQPRLRHFVIEGDNAHRVYCCDRCRRYIKTVDERVSAAPANLLVDDVITPHLDILAREQGYR